MQTTIFNTVQQNEVTQKRRNEDWVSEDRCNHPKKYIQIDEDEVSVTKRAYCKVCGCFKNVWCQEF